MGVAPEKAIKLTTNFTMRDLLTSKDRKLPLWKECIAGGCVSVCVCVHVCVCACMCVYVCPCDCTRVCVCNFASECMFAHVCAHMCVCVCVYMCTHVHAYIRTCYDCKAYSIQGLHPQILCIRDLLLNLSPSPNFEYNIAMPLIITVDDAILGRSQSSVVH